MKIEKITAFVSADEDGEEGILAVSTPTGMMPLIGADSDRIKSLYPIAVEVSRQANRTFRVLEFSEGVDITQEIETLYGRNERTTD